MPVVTQDPHPLLDAVVLETTLPAALADLPTPDVVWPLFAVDAEAPVSRPEAAKTAVRDLLRAGGFKPAGRSKPASEYLIKAVEKGWLGRERSINAVVDLLNAVSLHSGLPISIIDLDRAEGPFRLAVCPEGARYVFNAGGQEIDLSGLLCLHDASGPCANAVKDSHRTKTHPGTRRALTVVWGTRALPGHARAVADWYTALLDGLGAQTAALAVVGGDP